MSDKKAIFSVTTVEPSGVEMSKGSLNVSDISLLLSKYDWQANYVEYVRKYFSSEDNCYLPSIRVDIVSGKNFVAVTSLDGKLFVASHMISTFVKGWTRSSQEGAAEAICEWIEKISYEHDKK